jgi:hypothetical protein
LVTVGPLPEEFVHLHAIGDLLATRDVGHEPQEDLVRSFARDGALEMYHAVTAHDPELVHVDAAILTDEISQYPFDFTIQEWLEVRG